ncbi:ferritin-like domain-containing protein [Nannocystis pusilla]|uniref:Ferritin-like domain-containing protein n=1 Tax=Nannocystis pusilla TaxID=889268 RepID=A0ABS7TVE7_9BACT|nr:ferritin-like domain-containing protein [Nannocystis pusilla]MBZ5712238.1 ferritin-like domain-containing protein [Nannocystis pusilla]
MIDPYRLFLCSILVALGSACTVEGEACMAVDPSVEECPAPRDVDRDKLTGACGSKIVRVLGEGERVDNISDWVESEEDWVPGCCYPVKETKPNCDYGRPLRVEGEPVLAATVTDDRWAAALAVTASTLPQAVREELVIRWTRAALDEHASVAAFSRVALDLMRHGAPPELIEQAHAAALDEVRHARHGFAIASAIGGAPVGPGAFPLGASVPLAPDLVAVAVEAALDGCIGETVASLLAWEAAAVCEEPAIREVLRGIAEDEQRHALLGWRTVAWAIRHGGAAVRTAVAEVFAAAAREGVAVPLPGRLDDATVLAQVGLLDRATSQRHAARTLHQVILPAARDLLAGGARRGGAEREQEMRA